MPTKLLMLRSKFSIIFLLLLVLNTGCMSTKLIGNYDSDNVIHHKATKINYFWGIVRAKDVQANCESKSICQVTAQTNAGFILVSFVTLGIVVPQTVVWDCCPKEIKEELIE